MNLIEVFREGGRIFLVFEQLNRTILEELEGQGNSTTGIDPLEVQFELINFLLGKKDYLASAESLLVHSFSQHYASRHQT